MLHTSTDLLRIQSYDFRAILNEQALKYFIQKVHEKYCNVT